MPPILTDVQAAWARRRALHAIAELGPALVHPDGCRLGDVAGLTADLTAFVSGGVQSMFFTGFGTWRDLAARLGRLEPAHDSVTGDAATRAALAGLNWLTGNLRAFCPTVRTDADFARFRWEWHAAFAAHLLRMTYHHGRWRSWPR